MASRTPADHTLSCESILDADPTPRPLLVVALALSQNEPGTRTTPVPHVIVGVWPPGGPSLVPFGDALPISVDSCRDLLIASKWSERVWAAARKGVNS